MHHYRVTVNGAPAAVAALSADLGPLGAQVDPIADPVRALLATHEPVDPWEELTRRHPLARLSIESFTALEDELLHTVVEQGVTTTMARGSVLPAGWGCFADEDGVPLEPDVLHRAAARVAGTTLGYDLGLFSTGLDSALVMGRALGRFCELVEPTVLGDPPVEALEAVAELAVVALSVGRSTRSMTHAECAFEEALHLTRSMVHAGRDEMVDRPGHASWLWWVGVLVGAASAATDAAIECELAPEGGGCDFCPTPTEGLELAAAAVVTSCVQALALFSPDAATVD